MPEKLITYGAKLKSSQIKTILNHIFDRNVMTLKAGNLGTPVCIWGTHGLGKTQIIQDLAKEKNWQFAYCAPAQFEEMGDLHGMPEIVDPDKNVTGDEYTVFRPPEWIPKQEGPGILLIDDINRADDRILRGIMQLLQNFELFSWQLPPKWHIAATANPEGGDYSLTPMDDAMITRMLHLTLIFDARDWAVWATQAGIDNRGISFVLIYPEAVTGKRTTPRTLTQFFHQIKDIPDLKKEAELVSVLALSALDEVTASSFMAFVNDDLQILVEPDEILNATSFIEVEKRLKILSGDNKVKRVDRLATVCTRLYLKLLEPAYKPAKNHQENLISFILMKELPNDLRFSLSMDITKNASEEVKAMLRDKRIANIILKEM